MDDLLASISPVEVISVATRHRTSWPEVVIRMAVPLEHAGHLLANTQQLMDGAVTVGFYRNAPPGEQQEEEATHGGQNGATPETNQAAAAAG